MAVIKNIVILALVLIAWEAKADNLDNTLGMKSSLHIEKRLSETEGLSHHHATGIVQDQDRVIWIGTWNGLNRYDGYGFTTFKPQPGDGSEMGVNRIKDIHIKGYEIYCNVESQCFVFDIRDGKFRDAHMTWEQALVKYKFPAQSTRHLCGQDGVSWSIDSLGLRMSYKYPSYYKRLLSQPGCQVRSLFRDKEGLIWVCSRDDRSVRIYDGKLELLGFLGSDGTVRPNKSEFLSAVYCMFQDKEGTLWLGCKPGELMQLRKIADGKYSIKSLKEDINGKSIGRDVYGIEQDKWGRLWIATMGSGLYCILNTTEGMRSFRAKLGNEALPQKYKSVRTVYINQDNILLAGTTQGLFAAQLTEATPENLQFQKHEREGLRYGSLSSSSIMSIMEDKQHDLYVCTEGGGINMVKQKEKLLSPDLEFLHMDKQKISQDFVSSAFEYGDFIWLVGTNNLVGLDIHRDLFMSFDHRTWLDKLLFTDARPLDLGHGKWLFGLMDGLAVIDIEKLLKRETPPSIVLTSVLIEDSELDEATSTLDTIRLGERQRNVKIDFAAIDFVNSASQTYRFQLDDGDWNDLENNHSVTLLNLSPGTHQLLLESKITTRHWSGNVKEVTILVKPTIWQTTTAKCLYVLFAVLVILGTYLLVNSLRDNRRKQKELLDSYLDLLNRYEKDKKQDGNKPTDLSSDDTDIDKSEDLTSAKETSIDQKQLSEEEQLFMQRIIDFVDQHIEDSELSVIELAEELSVSKSGLNRKLKSLVGVSPKELITKARMNRAVRMLETTQLSIKEIAFSCGFCDQNYFGKCFRSVYGESPSEYRQKHNG